MQNSDNFYVICIKSQPDVNHLVIGNKYLVTSVVDEKYYEIGSYIWPIDRDYFITISDNRYRKISDILNR